MSGPSAPQPSVPKALLARYREITELTDALCDELLTDEYRMLCREMTAAICRKRPSPITSGTGILWAAGIAYTVGQINFLFDPTQNPHVTQQALCDALAQKRRSVHERSNLIMKLLKTQKADPKWWRPSNMGDNPFVWLVQTASGIVVDARKMPIEFQREAFECGAIPYIP